SFPTTKTYFP
uniref:ANTIGONDADOTROPIC DECAPEPTIDE, AGD n=1 Tax=Bos taurus TaxID=9913 RepID=Q9TRC1_BOVIN|nr:antigondadotropic decapeptide, AGD [cattle, pineal glands, Peptide, 10 aa] [Bos taurus]